MNEGVRRKPAAFLGLPGCIENKKGPFREEQPFKDNGMFIILI
jgi:hypothetical protein